MIEHVRWLGDLQHRPQSMAREQRLASSPSPKLEQSRWWGWYRFLPVTLPLLPTLLWVEAHRHWVAWWRKRMTPLGLELGQGQRVAPLKGNSSCLLCRRPIVSPSQCPS